MKRLFLAAALAASFGCKRPAPAADGGPLPAAAAAPAAAGWSDAELKAYLAFQEGLISVIGPQRLADGGWGKPRLRTEEELAYEEGKLRRQSGLTDQQIDTLNRLTAALGTRKVLQKVADMEELQEELRRAREELPDGSVPEVDAALEVMAERKKREAAYTEERARFGDALVNAALPHEEALLQNWARMMSGAHEYGEAKEGEH